MAILVLTSVSFAQDATTISYPADSVSADGKISYHGNRFSAEQAFNVEKITESFKKSQENDVKIDIDHLAVSDVTLKGTVEAVCQAKGCWMTMKMPDGQDMRIKFKDYGFFVPKDIVGKTAIIKGEMNLKTIPVEEQRHYAEDGGMSREEAEKKFTKEKKSYEFLAEGVMVEIQ